MRFNKPQPIKLVLLIILLGIGLTACGQETATTTPRPASTSSPQQPTLLPTLVLDELQPPEGFVMPVNTPPPIPVDTNDSRFPINIPTDEAFDQAAMLYALHCAECHGINGEGQQPDPFAPGAAPPHTDDGHTWHHPDQANFATVWSGTQYLGGNMPGFHDQLNPGEIIAILGYVKQWWNDEAWNIQRERTAITAQAGG